MLTLTQVKTTYTGQLSKPENFKMLQDTVAAGDKSPEAFAKYYFQIIQALRNTPAWNMPKTNEMINDLTFKVKATLAGAKKKGKSSAVAHANTLINKIEWCSKTEAKGVSWHRIPLEPLLTQEEVEVLIANASKERAKDESKRID